ncbi:MAG TPA: TspO/MBR family protein [Abditibacterium sp.]|jgi:tryptophan-rich sensory protein
MLPAKNLWPKIALGVGLCELAGFLACLWTIPALRDWYPSLQKPQWTPPDAVFGPVWIVLYALMGVAVGLIWARGLGSRREKRAFAWFWGQLALGLIWSAVFFGLRSPGWGYAIIIALWLSVAATLWLFSKISRAAAWFLAPTLLGVTLASMLNFGILGLNVIKPGVQKMNTDPRNIPTPRPTLRPELL